MRVVSGIWDGVDAYSGLDEPSWLMDLVRVVWLLLAWGDVVSGGGREMVGEQY